MDTTPHHLGFIVDGNRRWAKSRHLPTIQGHAKGLDIVEEITEACFERGVKFVSCYIFSNENWSRSAEEVSYLMKMVTLNVKRLVKRCLKNNIRLVILGSKERLSAAVLKAIETAERDTADCDRGTLGLCFNYGGRLEIIDAARSIQGEITEDKISAALYHPEMPDIDMIVRTSGEQRISGFMLWRSAYAELMFLDKYWPDLTIADLDEILAEYARRNRRFGK